MSRVYLDFIRYCLHQKEELPERIITICWEDFIAFCRRQGVLGLVLEGMDRSKLSVPSNVVLEWFSYVERIKSENLLLDKRSVEVSHFFKEKNYRSCILKGQANALYYPDPELRSPGDIDIWVDGNEIEIIKLILKKYPDAHYSIHHVKFPIYADTSVEVHYRPVYMSNWFKDKVLQRFIHKKEEEQFEHLEKLKDGKIGVLTNEFNLVFQMLHMYNHFFTSRNNLKQMIDYYYLLKKSFNEETDTKEVLALIDDLGVKKYAAGMMWIQKEILGIEEDALLLTPNSEYGKIILREMLTFGNRMESSKLSLVIHQIVSNLRLIPYFPFEVLINPLFLVWHQWWKMKVRWFLKRWRAGNGGTGTCSATIGVG